VYKCLVKHYEDLDGKCQKELGRAYHMAFFVWQPESTLTSECDKDVKVGAGKAGGVSAFCTADPRCGPSGWFSQSPVQPEPGLDGMPVDDLPNPQSSLGLGLVTKLAVMR